MREPEPVYRHPPDGMVLDALADDIARWYRAEAERDVEGMLRVAYRLQHRRGEVDTLRDDGRWVKADADLVPVETAMAALEPVYALTRPVEQPVELGWDDETHWGRWWPTYLGVTAAVAGVMVVLWVVTALVAALAAALATLVPVLLGVLGVVVLIVLLSALGGGGGRGFTFSGSGRLH